MNLLAIETSSDIGSVALKIEDEVDQRFIDDPKQQTKVIIPLIEEMLRSRKISLHDLDGIAFGMGPGSFTGIRVATAISQGFGYSASIPLLPVSSLVALAQGYSDRMLKGNALVCIDAKMGEVFWGMYKIYGGIACPLLEEGLIKPSDISPVGDNDCIYLGNAFEVYKDLLNHIVKDINKVYVDARPNAKNLLPKAILDLEEGLESNSDDIVPNYFRDSSAWINN